MQNEKRGNTNSPKRIQTCIEQIEERMYVKKDQRGGERGEAGQTGGGNDMEDGEGENWQDILS